MRFLAAAAWLAWAVPCAHALDPALDVEQYAHNAWRVREGFVRGTIHKMAQTTDGYLWLGTEDGLVRFDGIRAVPWRGEDGQRLPNDFVRALSASRDGGLWIGTLSGIAFLRDGRLTSWPQLAGMMINDVMEDRRGTLWITASGERGPTLCTIRGGDVKCQGEDRVLGTFLASLCEDSQGRVWAANQTGIVQLYPGEPRVYPLAGIATTLHILAPGKDGSLFALTDKNEVVRFADGKAERTPIPMPTTMRFVAILHDRDGALWLASTEQGLVHVREGRVDVFARADGLSSNAVADLYEDREGNVWIATQEGLDRFNALAVASMSPRQGIGSTIVASVAAARDDSVWVSARGAINVWRQGRFTAPRIEGLPVRAASLLEDSRGRMWIGAHDGIGYVERGRFVRLKEIPPGTVDSIAEDTAGSIWIALRDHGLVERTRDGAIALTPWDRLGLARGDAASRLAGAPDGGLWLGFREGGVARLAEGRVVETHGRGVGLADGFVRALYVQPDGTLWFANPHGLVRVKNGRTGTLGTANGLPCEAVDSVLEDAAASFWVYANCGLIKLERGEWQAWAAAADRGEAEITRVRSSVLDASDGIAAGVFIGSYGPHAAMTRDGRMWLVMPRGLAVMDPSRQHRNPIPPPVRIEQVLADRKAFDVAQGGGALRLPALVRDLQIDYTALSFNNPEKVRFRHRLEGRDAGWSDVGARRQAFYTDLPPGEYRFRVIAANNSGVWNETGAMLAFSIPPAYYQTPWFRAGVAVVAIALLWALYLLRLRRLKRQFDLRVRERVAERTRIARELHDTLLQTFQGTLLNFHTASSLLPARPEEAKRKLEHVIDQAAEAIAEGRDAVQGLRASTSISNDLAEDLARLGEEAGADGGDAPKLAVNVKGEARDLVPLVRDEVHRIAREAIRNAFRHSRAHRVDVFIHYERRTFTLRVRDDGTGIPPEVLAAGGRPGHYGLAGMDERAQLVGGTLAVRSGPGLGTEVTLQVPASNAYSKEKRAQAR